MRNIDPPLFVMKRGAAINTARTPRGRYARQSVALGRIALLGANDLTGTFTRWKGETTPW
jgi:hypothetical protein